jgi:predicted GNAT family acetyltransferase
MSEMPDKIVVQNNPAKSRFEVQLEEQVALIQYTLAGDTIIFNHTEVPAALEGRGIAGKMARTALEHAREQGLKVVPTCSYVAGYIRKHPEYQSLV